jgi:lysyl-tRNA synthetase class 2
LRFSNALRRAKVEPATFISAPFASDAEAKSQRLLLVDLVWQEHHDELAGGDAGELNEIRIGERIAEIFEEIAEDYLIQPTFITDFPKPISPLSKASPSDPSVAERFEYFVGGLESANGFSELNDPEEQYQRFKDQEQQRERGDEEAMVMDEDYIRALSYGMPPAAGIGVGIDRLVMLLANKQSIRDVILFPHLRPEKRADDES